MDYKKSAEELFEIAIMGTGFDAEAFNAICDRYPELMNNYVKQIEEEIKDVELLKQTEEEQKEQWLKLCERIRETYGQDAI